MRQFSCERLVREMRQECTTFQAVRCELCRQTGPNLRGIIPTCHDVCTNLKSRATAKMKKYRRTCVRNTAKPLCKWGVTRLSKGGPRRKSEEALMQHGHVGQWACSGRPRQAPVGELSASGATSASVQGDGLHTGLCMQVLHGPAPPGGAAPLPATSPLEQRTHEPLEP